MPITRTVVIVTLCGLFAVACGRPSSFLPSPTPKPIAALPVAVVVPSPVPTPTETVPSAPADTIAPSATSRGAATPTVVVRPTTRPSATPKSTARPVISTRIISRGPSSSKEVALTFDAGGTDRGSAPAILATLEKDKVPATYFMTGTWAAKNPDLVREIAAAGEEMANHTYDHPDLTTLSDSKVASELTSAADIVERIAGVHFIDYMRPPFGSYNARVVRDVTNAGYNVVMWSLDSTDWRHESTSASIIQRVSTETQAGYIVVFHAYPPKTAQALPTVIQRLRARGFTLTKLSTLLAPH